MRPTYLVFSLAIALTGCAAGGHAVPAGGPANPGTTALAVHIDVPLAGPSSNRRPAYVSPATQSLAIAVLSAGLPGVGYYVNLFPTSPACQTTAAGLTCSVNIPLPIAGGGAYTLSTATYDEPQTHSCLPGGTPACAGNLLSEETLATTLTLNTVNTVSLVLGGVATSITATPLANGVFTGNVVGLHVWGPQAQTVTLQALDADGNTIVGSGAPALTLTAISPTVQVAALTPGSFSIQATTSLSPPVVTPGVLPLTATATPATQSGASPLVVSVPLTISHTGVFVSNGGNVLAFLDGNTTSSLTLSNTNGPRGVAVDANGTVYVGNHGGGGSVTECAAANTYANCTVAISGLAAVEGVAIDAGGNLWVANSLGVNIIEYLAGQTTANLVIPSALATMRGVAVDSNGNLWVSDQSGVVEGFAPPLTASSTTPFATLTNGISAPIQAAGDASGNLWVANSGGVVQEYTAPIASASLPAISLTAASAAPEGVAVDSSGDVWLANTGNGTVTECPPPVGTATCTSFSLPGALWLGVYPAAIDP